MLTRIPQELQALAQWAVAGADKAPLGKRLFNISVTNPEGWLTFAEACSLVEQHKGLITSASKDGCVVTEQGLHAGFIVSKSDPFTCIDLDVKDPATHPNNPELWTTQAEFDRYWSMTQGFASYTELSRSGKGLHIWVKGDVGLGHRRDGVEVYSHSRFIICTGNPVVLQPIAERQELLTTMVSRMTPLAQAVAVALDDAPAEDDDWAVLETAFAASNSDKFLDLWKGDWKSLGYPSQSEADLSLMSMLTFYSPSNDQCRRLFRESGLGKRDKATRDDKYLNRTLSTIRSREAAEKRIEDAVIAASASAAERLLLDQIAAMQGGVPAAQVAPAVDQFAQAPRTVSPLHTPGAVAAGGNIPSSASTVAAQLAPSGTGSFDPEGIPWPPGVAGAIARFVFGCANRPVREVAIVAALGVLAGLCGKNWTIPQSGLNLYVVLIARSGVGKEAMHTGISSIVSECSKLNPTFGNFFDFTDYASGPALIKGCLANPCFVNVSGEWGRKLKRLAADDGRDGALQTLRTQMTNLYQKSGPTSIAGGISYSARDQNVESVSGVSYSMIGETTPGTFYDALTESMMEDGFLSRFLIVEYNGPRVAENEQIIGVPDAALVDVLNRICSHAVAGHQTAVRSDAESQPMMKAFTKECDVQINATEDESRRQMWNRAALKSLRVAALLAVADNYLDPIIRKHHLEWAQMLVRADIAVMTKRLDGGDVGESDNSRDLKIKSFIEDYFADKPGGGYRIPKKMRSNNIVPRTYLHARAGRVAAFYKHKLGVTRAFEDSINNLIMNGYLMEVARDKLIEGYGTFGKAYRVLSTDSE